MKLPKLNMSGAGKMGAIKVGGPAGLKAGPGMPKTAAGSNVRPHLAGVSSHRLSLRGKSAFPPTSPTAFMPPAGAGGGAPAGPVAAFAGGAGPAGAAGGDMGD
jgi:hypothetical protein